MKVAVKEQDQSQYGKLRKLVCSEDAAENGHFSETGSVEAHEDNVKNFKKISEEFCFSYYRMEALKTIINIPL